jgi:hypothetical protein
MLTPNRADKRWDFVFKTYSTGNQAPILFDVAAFAYFLMGLDREVTTVARTRESYMRAVYGPAYERKELDGLYSPTNPWDPDAAAADLRWLGLSVSSALKGVGRHEYEALIPWYASRLAKLWKKRVRNEPLNVIPGYDGLYVHEWHDTKTMFNRYGTVLGELVKHYRMDVNRLSLAQALQHIDEWRENKMQILGMEGDVVMRFDDGWTVQKLTTRAQLQEEGNAMDHCVGSYCPQVERGDVVILSLRDADGQSRATLEWDTDEASWEQIQGPGNERVDEVTWPYLKELTETWAPEGQEPSPESAKSWFGEAGEVLKAAAEWGWDTYEYLGEGSLRGRGFVSSSDIRSINPQTAMEQGGEYLVAIRNTSGGYGATLYDQANRRAIEKEFGEHPDVIDSPYTMFVNAASSDPEMLELLQALEYDPIYDSEMLSEVEMEEADSSWQGWVSRDYTEKVSRLFGEDSEDEEAIEEAMDFVDQGTRDELRGVFETARERANVYWELDGDGMTIDVEKVADATYPYDLFAPLVGVDYERQWSQTDAPILEPLVRWFEKALGMSQRPTASELKVIITGLHDEGVSPGWDVGQDHGQMSLGLSTEMMRQLARRMPETIKDEYRGIAASWMTLHTLWEIASEAERGQRELRFVQAAHIINENQDAIRKSLSTARSWKRFYSEEADAAE